MSGHEQAISILLFHSTCHLLVHRALPDNGDVATGVDGNGRKWVIPSLVLLMGGGGLIQEILR